VAEQDHRHYIVCGVAAQKPADRIHGFDVLIHVLFAERWTVT